MFSKLIRSFFANAVICSTLASSENVAIENQVNTTVVFPDSTLPQPTNGGFESQEAFREFVSNHQSRGRWNSALHSRPLDKRLADYDGDTISQAFPLLFPFGHSGLAEDKAVVAMRKMERNKTHMNRQRLDVLRKFLRHRNRNFHQAMFNLIVEDLIMKEQIFQSTKMYCNAKQSDGSGMGEKYGSMKAADLSRAIENVRQNQSVQHSSSPENRYLKSIRSSCESLPHSNESALAARVKYFSFLISFGLPCIFLTVTPDDTCNFRIIVYSLMQKQYVFGGIDPNDFTDEQIIGDYKVRQDARVNYPGLCAEEYNRIIEAVIKNIFCWNETEQKSTGVGLFAEVLAWCLATEEQGRKSLHGHFLMFVKDWKKMLNVLQRKEAMENANEISCLQAKRSSLAFYRNACSARLFADFARPCGPMDRRPVFHHTNCRAPRNPKEMRFTVQPVEDQAFREMRHKVHCHKHGGTIATCLGCEKLFTVNEIVLNAINCHMGNSNTLPQVNFKFPDTSSRRLDRHVFEMHKDFAWQNGSDYDIARRYFAGNALTNVHLTTHANRCFKKGAECYAYLPESVMECAKIVYNEEPDVWSNWCGIKEKRFMFRFYPERAVEDTFMNTHNPTMTKLLLCNNNIMVGMNGQSVFYVTGYNVKAQQKEERAAFQKVAEAILGVLKRQVKC